MGVGESVASNLGPAGISPPQAPPTPVDDTTGQSKPGVAAVWMGVTTLALIYVPSFFAEYFEFWFSFAVVVHVAVAAGIAFGASILLPQYIEADVPRGAVLGLLSWLGGSVVVALLFWGIGAEIMGWFSVRGILEILLAAGSGVGLALFLRR